MKAAIRLVKSRGLDADAFFRAYAKLYVMTVPETIELFLYYYDTHAPSYLRANVNVQMMDEFCETYGVKEGDGMYVKPENRLKIWGK